MPTKAASTVRRSALSVRASALWGGFAALVPRLTCAFAAR